MANCPNCDAEVLAGTRWCGVCHTNIIAPEIGRLASPGKRLGAYFLDWLIPIVALFLIFLVGGGIAAIGDGKGGGAGLVLGILLFIAYIVWSLVLFARGTTPGKKLLGMRVIREDGSNPGFFIMLVREWIGKAISGMILSLGYLWILFDQDNQGWHDKLVSTYVVR